MNDHYAALVGLDWADEKHDLCWKVPGEDQVYAREIEQSPEKIRDWVAGLMKRFPECRYAVCLEQSRGPVVNALMGYGAIDLFPLNPSSMKNYRKAFYPSGAKDDPTDAKLMLEMLERHRDSMRLWKPDTVETRRLRFLCEDRRKLVDLRSGQLNRLRAGLKQFYPQALKMADDIGSELFCAFLMKWPDFEKLSLARPDTVRSFYHRYNSRNEHKIAERLELIRESQPLCNDAAVIDSGRMLAEALVAEIRLLNKQIKKYDERICVFYQSHPDHEVFSSFPGAGEHLGPRVLVCFGSDRERYDSAESAANYIGISPVTQRSGKQEWIHWRWHRPKFLSQSLVEFARCSLGYSDWAMVFYERQKSRGKSHQAAIRSLAYKWVRIIYRCWKDHEPYDEVKYMASLARNGSWIPHEVGKEQLA